MKRQIFAKFIRVLFSFSMYLLPLSALAVGIGSQGIGADFRSGDDGGPTGPLSLVVALASTAIGWWFAFSEKSPFKNNFWLMMAAFLFGPAIVGMIAIAVIKWGFL